MQGFRARVLTEGVSKGAADLIANSRRECSLANYNLFWCKWISWCDKKQIDPFRYSTNYFLRFLAELFDEGYKHRKINSYRSAISTYHEKVEGTPVGKHEYLCSLTSRVFNCRPPQPKHSCM